MVLPIASTEGFNELFCGLAESYAVSCDRSVIHHESNSLDTWISTMNLS